MLLFVFSNGKAPRVVSSKWIMYFAVISYPFYLLHSKIGFAIVYQLRRLGLMSEFMLLIPFVVIVIMSIIIHKFVEEPGAKLVSSVFDKIECRIRKK